MAKIQIQHFVQRSEPVTVNCYLLSDPMSQEALVIDPGGDAGRIVEALNSAGWRLKYIVLTHGHFDHTMCTAELACRTGAQVCMSEKDLRFVYDSNLNAANFAGAAPVAYFPVDIFLRDGDKLPLGQEALAVLETPGHTPGELSLYVPGHLFCGDTILRGTTGRMDLPGADPQLAAQAIAEKIFVLPDDTILHCGHGMCSSIAYERANNNIIIKKGI